MLFIKNVIRKLHTNYVFLYTVALTLFLPVFFEETRAQILPTQITYTGLQTVTYSPGLTYEQQDVDVNLQANLICVSFSNPTIISAARTLQVTVPRSCNDLLNGGTIVVDTAWNTGETSQETMNYTISYVGGQIIVLGQGSITQGKFLGSVTTDTQTLLGDISACSTPEGLTTLNGPVTFNVLL